MIDVFTNIKDIRKRLQYVQCQGSEEETDMCKALEDIKKYEMKKGVKQGERMGTIKTLCALVNDGLLKLEEAARRAGLSEEAFGKEMKRAGYREI